MQINITGHHFSVSPALKKHTLEKLIKVCKFFSVAIHADVIFKVEKFTYVAEVSVHANGVDLHGREKTNNPYTAIDNVIAKIDRQVEKVKGKTLKRKRKGKPLGEEIIDLTS
ncbi:MAG TPA: ribosome-associated translation inhibitor RaiA [Nitrospinota bacterium]|nr:ribosome-associated translation inhibitor RaiA [Nitrospinota bacterium]|tara:strand:+ start:8684 stop:9019 length:336 start_codon:yes stop_codon:yes gene_type:complete